MKHSVPIQIDPQGAIQELAEMNGRFIQSIQTISSLTDRDIQYGASAKNAVYRDGKMVLYHFEPLVEKKINTPVLISYALVNRPYMADLQENRSLIRNLLRLGLDIYLIDWGYPGRAERWLTLDDYINGYINDCVDTVLQRSGEEQINLLGICQGGVFGLCYSALHPQKVKNLITMVTPVDFDVEGGLLNAWVGCGPGAESVDADLMVEALGNIPGDFMNFGYLMLKPYMLNVQKYLGLVAAADNREKVADFLRMEKWIFDSPDQAGEAWRQFVKDFYQENKLIKGEVKIGNQRVDLRALNMPVLNLYAEEDHLVPPDSSKALKHYVSSGDYTVRSFPAGHIGMYVSSKVQKALPPLIAEWLERRDR